MWIRAKDGELCNLDTGCLIRYEQGRRTAVHFPGEHFGVTLGEGNIMEELYEIIPIEHDFFKEDKK